MNLNEHLSLVPSLAPHLWVKIRPNKEKKRKHFLLFSTILFGCQALTLAIASIITVFVVTICYYTDFVEHTKLRLATSIQTSITNQNNPIGLVWFYIAHNYYTAINLFITYFSLRSYFLLITSSTHQYAFVWHVYWPNWPHQIPFNLQFRLS